MIELDTDLIMYTHFDPDVPVWKVLPTNYSVDSKGLAIMGAGLAKQFVNTYGRRAAYELGVLIQSNPTVPRLLPLGIKGNAFWWALPTKHHPEDNSSADLLRSGLWELSLYYQRQCKPPAVMVPRLGCGCGKMQWRHAKPIIEIELYKVKELIVCHLSNYNESSSVRKNNTPNTE